MNEENAINKITDQFGLMAPGNNYQEKLNALAGKINNLLNNDFQKLIGILYRMDISEPKLRRLLGENPNTDAGLIIAKMMIEREVQKIKSRKESRKKDEDIDEEEKW